MFEIFFRIVLEIILLFSTAFFILKADGYRKYVMRRFRNEDEDIPPYMIIQLSTYVGIAFIGIYDVCDNFITLIKLF